MTPSVVAPPAPGFATAAFVAAALALVNLGGGWRSLLESHQAGQSTGRSSASLSARLRVLGHPTIGRILVASFLGTIAFVSLEATFALFGQRRFGLDSAGLGLIFTVVGIVIAVVQGGLLGRLSRRFEGRALARTGALVLGLSRLILPLVPNLPLVIAVLAGTAVGQGRLSPTRSSLLALEASVEEQGAVLGLGQSLAAAARAVAVLLSGVRPRTAPKVREVVG
jgi:DHA1 family tetracycline resistance protein-like MFS transporter